ncbi:CinA family protein [Insolitispirillum peregrinum]|uniref:CinA family protein n=1 Tax=Insolitispirillum peregrinum TaxID=80876 RepID=UPI00361B5612
MAFFPSSALDLAENVLKACRERGILLVTAESCTGGLIGAIITAIPGSSDVFHAGYVTYGNSAKETMLEIPPSLIRRDGAVSEAVAFAMARGALEESPAGVAVAVTGVAGPGGGSENKPVGTVHIAVVTEGGNTLHRICLFDGDRDGIRLQTAEMAMRLVLEILGAE